jgi:hypothetical protein
MKTDRELVDAAAKAGIAAGMPLFQRSGAGAEAPAQWMITITSAGGTPVEMPWEPLDNDADACSLIVAMPLSVDFDDSTVYIHYRDQLVWEAVYSGAVDRPGITRRAIVLVVASIGQRQH